MVLDYMNAIICGAIAIRLMCFRQKTSQHKFWYSCVAYVLTVTSAAICIRIVMKQYSNVDVSEVIMNLVVCISVYATKGNVARFMRWEPK